ncbi:MAG: nucleoside-diphosphate kinase [Armatimonadota bacterium]|nr:nucleoside-diphosphate kinase [Armatimonadota bacterium]MDR7401178.1 nucleoside-diphosphate kinase [Armatimonadota bacterium]MDR7403402.1 nucleoside-diphosphate kinase [Armatimonadota bacterium]MDR7438007.1 nucleoside-diphosphate kinase [Armatimonadota bacterium]MDR7471833.1 nucleoside-diphosphate kinase [Armatimonadota bacterium]
MKEIRRERTLVFVKPDGVQRGLVGEVIGRFERAGLKLVGLKMVWPDRALLDRHYPRDEGFLRTIGGKTREAFASYGLDVRQQTGTDDPVEIGRQVRQWLIDYVSSGPVVALVLEGVHAVSVVRKLVGDTLPYRAAPGTIRGDFSVDSPTVANLMKRPVRNLIHASGSVEEAALEIPLWFAEAELYEYPRADEAVMFGE